MGCLKLAYRTNDTALKVAHRKYVSDRNSYAEAYRYGFNGKEKDNEVNVDGGDYGFEARIFDSRIGKFLSTDPRQMEYLWQSPYAYFKNAPISILDYKGMGAALSSKKQGEGEGKDNTWWRRMRWNIKSFLLTGSTKCISEEDKSNSVNKDIIQIIVRKKNGSASYNGKWMPINCRSSEKPGPSSTPPGSSTVPGAPGSLFAGPPTPATMATTTGLGFLYSDAMYPTGGTPPGPLAGVINTTATLPVTPFGTGNVNVAFSNNIATATPPWTDAVNNNVLITNAATGAILWQYNAGLVAPTATVVANFAVTPGTTLNIIITPVMPGAIPAGSLMGTIQGVFNNDRFFLRLNFTSP